MCRVNLENGDLHVREQMPVQHQESVPAGPRIERCEFEELLQRAMEILNARELRVQLKSAETPFST
jgi:hypothetical protein